MKSIKLFATIALILGVLSASCPRQAQAQSPSWLSSAVIYCVNPEIFSTSGIAGVTAQLPRLKSLGVNVIWLMPIYPRGQACTVGGVNRPSFNSPYDINNMEAIDPNVGTSAQLTTLISTAHTDGMKVILDVALNCTSWDNPLITSNPQYYLHTDGNVNNVASIKTGWGMDNDIAQFDLTQNTYGAQTYVTNVMTYWENNYGFDGFRFDSADDPGGPTRSFPASLAQSIATALKNINPNVLLLGEEFDQIQLALAPYGLDYDVFNLQSALQTACTSGNSSSGIQSAWTNSFSGWPAGMVHMAVTQDWDLSEDLSMYGGTAQTMDAAVTNFTLGGYVPEIFNGEEVANTASGNNTHNQIIWNGSNATAFTNFYTALIALHTSHPALQTNGTMTWETNSASSAVTTYDRLSGSDEVFVEVNFSGSAQSGTVTVPSGNAWTDSSPSGSPGGTSHELPSTGSFSLAPYDFAIFVRSTTPQAPPTPTGLAASPGNGQISLSWNASSGATSYNVYRGTSSGGEGTTPLVSGVSATSYTNTGLTNGTTYYYKVAAVNSVGTSSQSSEQSATPSSATGSLSGTPTNVTSAQAFNLTNQGTSDWAAWGFNGMDRDSSGGSKIGSASAYGGGSMTSFTSSFLGFTWTNGTPDGSETNETAGYYNNAGVGDGFQFTVPAGTTSQTLYVYVGGWSSGGTLTATLSDGSAAAYSNSSMSNAGNSYYGYYTLTFNAASAGQTLTVVWKEASGTGNVTLFAAALQGASLPTAATPTFSPAPGSYNGTQSVTLSDTTTGASIYYTTDGSTPTTSSTHYTAAISVSSTETIKAIAAASGYNNSAVASGAYTITQIPAAPTNLTATAGSGQVALSWSSSSGAATYNVYRGTSSGGEGTTPIATGVSSTSYTNTGLSNGTTYYYEVAAVNSAGTSGMSNEKSATPAASGSLSGTPTNVTTATAFNLTTQGTTDWAAWGFNGTDRDSSGGSKIGSLSVYGTGALNSFTSSFLGMTWTNGTPDTSETNETKGYYNNAGVGDGFQFTVPASTTVQHVTVYVGGWSTGGTLTATLSDGSASAYSDSSMSNGSNSYYGYYTLTYSAASASQTLTIVWKQASGTGNVTVYGAALH